MKTKFYARLCAIALSMVLVFANSVTVLADNSDLSSVSGNDATVSGNDATVSGNDIADNESIDDGNVDNENTDNENIDNENIGNENPGNENADNENTKQKLSTPTDVKWADDGSWNLQWTAVENAHGYYDYEIYKDGKVYDYTSWSGLPTEGTIETVESDTINDSGTYKFRVKACADYDRDSYEDSEWSEFSTEKIYTRPETVLGSTVGYWDDTTVGLFHYPAVENAGGYKLALYRTGEEGYEYVIYSTWSYYYDFTAVEYTHDFSDVLQEYGAGKYRVTVTALSASIDQIANGPEGGFSDYYNTADTSADVNDTINDAINDTETATEALSIIKNEVESDDLAIAMQTDPNVLEKIETLEGEYKTENNIIVEENVVGKASELIDSDAVSMVGAALNAENANDTVSLNISCPAPGEEVEVSNTYAKSVQLDIKLLRNDQSVEGQLDVPITITLPIPNGLNAEKLVIIHHHGNGDVKKIEPLVDATNRTVTFTVKDFSTFVFANEKDTTTNTTPDNGSNNSGNTNQGASTTVSTTATSTADVQTVTKSPQTGESDFTLFYIFILAASLLGLTVVCKKTKVK